MYTSQVAPRIEQGKLKKNKIRRLFHDQKKKKNQRERPYSLCWKNLIGSHQAFSLYFK